MNKALTSIATKILGGTHLIGQTIADASLNAEIKLRQTEELPARAIIDARLTKTMQLQAKAGIYSPFNSIASMDASQQ